VEGKWIDLPIENADDCDGGLWCFFWGSRVVPLPDLTLLIVGGTGKGLATTKDTVYQYNLETSHIFRRRNMYEKREAPAVVYYDNYAYVLGGKFSYKT
jgi:hypothetical protein